MQHHLVLSEKVDSAERGDMESAALSTAVDLYTDYIHREPKKRESCFHRSIKRECECDSVYTIYMRYGLRWRGCSMLCPASLPRPRSIGLI